MISSVFYIHLFSYCHLYVLISKTEIFFKIPMKVVKNTANVYACY